MANTFRHLKQKETAIYHTYSFVVGGSDTPAASDEKW